MKTTHKSSEKSSRRVKDLLVEDPKSHHLLAQQKPVKASANVAHLIEVKQVKDKKLRAARLLVSSISLCLSLVFAIGMFEWKFVENGSQVALNISDRDFEDLLDIPQTEQIQKPPVQAQAPMIIEVPDEEIIEDIEIDLDIEMTEETRIEEVIFHKESGEPIPEESADEIFVIVEEQPLPKGGYKAFYEFVGQNLRYPAQARRMGIEGRVFVEFVVEKDGSLTDIKVARGIGAGCNEEAIRVIASAPNWNPGKQRGREVRVRMIMPIVFKLVT